MRNNATQLSSEKRKYFPTIASFVLVLAFPVAMGATVANAQSVATQASAAHAATPQWQIDAGGKLEFDVASVKQNTAAMSQDTVHSNIPLGPMDAFVPTGGLLSATNYTLYQYMVFAYKPTPNELDEMRSQLPKWANTNGYDIQARASGNPTKDQFRLMMQTLLADRFKLAIHFETRQVPIMALIFDKPGKLGSQIQHHPDDSPCSSAGPGSAPSVPSKVEGGFPEACGAITVWLSNTPGSLFLGARNVPLSMLATYMNAPRVTDIDRPVFDKTGLVGKFDFVIEFSPAGPLPDLQADPTGPTFLEALKEQLGFKLESETGPVEVIVVDHIEQPSEN